MNWQHLSAKARTARCGILHSVYCPALLCLPLLLGVFASGWLCTWQDVAMGVPDTSCCLLKSLLYAVAVAFAQVCRCALP